jgi:hypothetical protein
MVNTQPAQMPSGSSQIVAPQCIPYTIKLGLPLVAGQKEYKLGYFDENSQEWGNWTRFLTNLSKHNENFQGEHHVIQSYGLRLGKLSSVVKTAEQERLEDTFIRSLRISLRFGQQKIVVVSFEGVSFLPIQSGPSASVHNNQSQSFENWIVVPAELRQDIPAQTFYEIFVECTLPDGTPSGIAAATADAAKTTPEYIMQFLMNTAKYQFDPRLPKNA